MDPLPNPDIRPVILFLGFLPLLNAWADFASTGLTRWTMRRGIISNVPLRALNNSILAILVPIALSFSIVATLHFIRPGGGASLINVPDLFRDLREPATRGDYQWLVFMLLSTLVPTFLHLCVGCLAVFTTVSKFFGRSIAAGLRKGDNPGGLAASLKLSLSAALAIWLPFFLIWHLLKFGGPFLLGLVLDLCEWFNTTLTTAFPLG